MTARQRRRLIMKVKQTSRIGPRCKDFMPGCVICACHHYYTLFKRYPTFEEAHQHNEDLIVLANMGVIK